jgi:mRNA interferase MazF
VSYIPKKGDFVVLSFNSQSGHEQQGRRPALVISNTSFNKRMGLAVVCPIINTDRKNPFHVPVDSDKLTGFVMSEQVKSIDYKTRKVQFVAPAKPKLVNNVLGIVDSIIQT